MYWVSGLRDSDLVRVAAWLRATHKGSGIEGLVFKALQVATVLIRDLGLGLKVGHERSGYRGVGSLASTMGVGGSRAKLDFRLRDGV